MRPLAPALSLTFRSNNGWDPANVVYFAFPGAKPDPLGGTDYDSLAALGMALLPRLDGMGGL